MGFEWEGSLGRQDRIEDLVMHSMENCPVLNGAIFNKNNSSLSKHKSTETS